MEIILFKKTDRGTAVLEPATTKDGKPDQYGQWRQLMLGETRPEDTLCATFVGLNDYELAGCLGGTSGQNAVAVTELAVTELAGPGLEEPPEGETAEARKARVKRNLERLGVLRRIRLGSLIVALSQVAEGPQ